MSQRRERQEQIGVGEAGVNSFSGRTSIEPLHFAADRVTLDGSGNATVTMNPGFADNKSYAVSATFDGGSPAAAPVAIGYTSGTQFTITWGVSAAGRNVRWIAIGVSA